MTVVLLSGGMDSTALASMFVKENIEIEAVAIDYGQRHRRELVAAEAVADHLGIPFETIDLTAVGDALTSSALVARAIDVPDGHYTAETMRATVVPNRNAIMLMVAVGLASDRGHSEVATAVHSGDHFIYPDCRPAFIDAISTAAALGTESFGDVRVTAPFINMTKADIVLCGTSADAPFDLSWSCYKGGWIHCGRCGTCVERAEAFHLAGVDDPTNYSDSQFWRDEIRRFGNETSGGLA